MQSLSDHLNKKIQQDNPRTQHHSKLPILVLGALGVVFGDIGTSPLYAIKESFLQSGLPIDQVNIFRILSLVFWLLMIVVTVKYVIYVMRCNNKGEGGDFALLALVLRLTRPNPKLYYFLGLLGVVGGSLFYADAVITPAISVLSAVEGIEIVAPSLHPFIVPVTLIILVGLFAVQKFGTSKMGTAFGPIMLTWFSVIGLMGLFSIVQTPEVLMAINPWYALEFIALHPLVCFLAMGAAVLSVTGAEALFADMGHFGRKPIAIVWLGLVWPCLLLNYFGQGALLLRDPSAIKNPFFLLAPDWFTIPLLILATLATIIASQSVISGAFSMTRQALQLGYLPRLRILHTSAKEMGQVYIPFVNWLQLAAVIVMVLMFQSSTHLAAAYGIAVTGAMLVTSIMIGVVMRLKWRWSWPAIIATAGSFFVVDAVLFSSTVTKIMHGGYVPMLLAVMIFSTLTTWRKGQMILSDKLARYSIPTEKFIKELLKKPPARVPGTSIFMTPRHNIVPNALMQNLKHNKILHERVILLTVVSQDVPYVREENRVQVFRLGHDFYQLDLHLGFKDEPDVPAALRLCQLRGMDFDHIQQASFFLGKETVIPTPAKGMAPWREHYFAWMKQNASSAIEYYKIPSDRVLEIAGRFEI